jgi:glycine oxidase
MITPVCELDSADADIAELGYLTLELLPDLVSSLSGEPVFFQRDGSLVLAHGRDRSDLDLFARRVLARNPPEGSLKRLGRTEIEALEPELADRFPSGYLASKEGQVDNRGLLRALETTLLEKGAEWITGSEVTAIRPGVITHGGGEVRCDVAADCRGLGARKDLAGLRGVRGELVHLHAPEVAITRPIRLLHPRYPIYVVPRPDNVYVVGATSIESEDRSPVSVQSLLELLSAAYTVHPGFAEARLLEARADCRPALVDNRPRVDHRPGLLSINGLYRHGYLLSPALTHLACDWLETGIVPEALRPFVPGGGGAEAMRRGPAAVELGRESP